MVQVHQPYAITMWDFSWLERRWPGAGYEDWDKALDELVERGYDAVRIDAYPHLIDADPEATWELVPVWNQHDWGAPAMVRVNVLPALLEFIGKAKKRGIGVGLSTWFREDRANTRMRILSPEDHGRIWVSVLDHLREADLLDSVLFVDLCNEYPMKTWAPFMYTNDFPPVKDGSKNRSNKEDFVADWAQRAVSTLKKAYPGVACTLSQVVGTDPMSGQDVAPLDFLEPHVWMHTVSDFDERIGGFLKHYYSPEGYENLVANGRRVYKDNREELESALFDAIDRIADWSREVQRHCVTTEAWSLVLYKDWPELDWDWILDLNARAVERAVATGRWIGLCTSNFTGPQYTGVWREVEYHRRLTSLIKAGQIELA